MKILMTADPVGGVWHYALELCSALRPYGAQVMLATLGRKPTAAQCQDVVRLPHVQLRTSAYRLEWMESPWNDLAKAGEWLLSLAEEFRPDVVHMNHLVHAHLPWNAPTLVVGHSCVLSWWAAVHGGTASGWSMYCDAVTKSLQSADLVVAPTQAMMSALEFHYGPFTRKRVIANARDAAHFRPERKQALILAAGRVWDEAKNVSALCAIAPEIPWPICVAGEERSPDGARGDTHGARSLGHLSATELAKWYSTAAIYALPARYEPFGLTILEAAHSGCALVLGDIPSLRENWDGCAAFVIPTDHQALRDTLKALIADPVGRRRQALRARERAQRFSPAAFAAGYWDAYRSLAHRKELDACASCFSTTP
jgi:glycogen(starch) synthase